MWWPLIPLIMADDDRRKFLKIAKRAIGAVSAWSPRAVPDMKYAAPPSRFSGALSEGARAWGARPWRAAYRR